MRTGKLLEGAGWWKGRHAYKYNIVSGPAEKKVTDGGARPGRFPKLVNFKAFCFLIISPVTVEHPVERSPGLPWVLPKIFLLPNLQVLIPKCLRLALGAGLLIDLGILAWG